MKIDKKISRIKALISRLEEGIDASTSSLSRVLSTQQFVEYNNEWKSYIDFVKSGKPIELKTYERKIKVAVLHYWKMERYSSIPSKHLLASKFGQKADNEFELALEHLKDSLASNPNLRIWIDRDPNGCEYHPDSIPRCVTSSKSICEEKRLMIYPFSSKKELKLLTLQMALYELETSGLSKFEEHVTFEIRPKSKNYEFSGFIY
jgi:hypothetical protein